MYLRWRAGESFQQGSWNLGEKWRWVNPVAVVFVILMVIALCLPFYSTAVPWESDFDWNALNYTPLVVGAVFLGAALAWVLGMNKRYTGPGPADRVRRGRGDHRGEARGPAGGAGVLSREEPGQLGEHERRALEHVAVGVAAVLVAAGVGFALAPAVLFPGVAGAVVAVAVELDGEPVVGPAAVDAVAAGGAVGLGQR